MSIRSRIKVLKSSGRTGPDISDRSGQAALLVGMLTFTFLLFVAFVLNIGMLVNAKINLQNAADMAALAGAGSQARHLNHIAFLNYEMRRQYKKFLFRQHVIGTLAYKDAPGVPGAPSAGQRAYTNVGGKPVTCLIFLASDNVCQNTEIKGFKIPDGNPLDNLQNTFKNTVQQFEAARQENCVLASTLNRAAVALWLLNTDPNLKNVSDALRGQSGADPNASSAVRAMETIQAVANGLGIYPREFLLRSRVRTLQGYVNESGKTGVTLESIDPFRGDIDPMAHERTILAFMSAFKSLGEGAFSRENITLDEMLPPAGDGGSDLLGLDPIEVQFDNYHSEFELVPNGRGNGSADCKRQLVPTLANPPLPVGFTKKLDKLVYYAVRVTADAKLLFNPFGGSIRISTYAAAQPFGSRIGPQVGAAEFTIEDFSSATLLGPDGDPCRINAPLLTCFNKRSHMELAPGIDFDSYALQTPLVQMTQVNQVVTFGGIQTAIDAAMTPSLSEIGKYTFPNDLPNDEKIQKFFDEPAAAINGKQTYAFWAPVLSPAKLATGSPEQALQEIFSGGAVSSGQTSTAVGTTISQGGKGVTSAFVQAFTDSIGRYVASLREGVGENGEGFNVVRLTNPFPASENGQLPPSIVMTTAKQARTSWNEPRDPDMISAGRVGYSIKLVPLKMLRNAETGSGAKPSTNNAGANFTNLLPGIDATADADLEKIEH